APRPWGVGRVPSGLLDPRGLQADGIGFAGVVLGGVAARVGFRDQPRAQQLLKPGWPGVDRLLLVALVVGQLALAIWGVWPGIVAELTPAGLVEMDGWPAAHAEA